MTAERKYLTPSGLVGADAYVRYLRQCAERWRHYPADTDAKRLENEEQARRVEARANAIEREVKP